MDFHSTKLSNYTIKTNFTFIFPQHFSSPIYQLLEAFLKGALARSLPNIELIHNRIRWHLLWQQSDVINTKFSFCFLLLKIPAHLKMRTVNRPWLLKQMWNDGRGDSSSTPANTLWAKRLSTPSARDSRQKPLQASLDIWTKSFQPSRLIRKQKYQTFTLTVITRGKARRSAALDIHFLTPLELSILGQDGLQFTLNWSIALPSFTDKSTGWTHHL